MLNLVGKRICVPVALPCLLLASTLAIISCAGSTKKLPAKGLLTPGTYRTQKYEPEMTFRIDRDWVIKNYETPSDLLMTPLSSEVALTREEIALVFLSDVYIISPALVREGDAGIPSRYQPGMLPSRPSGEDVISWLVDHPYLKETTEYPTTIKVGKEKAKAKQIDMVADPPR